MTQHRRAQGVERGFVQREERSPQAHVAPELGQDLAGQQQALLVEEDVALVHRPALVLHLDDDAAGRVDVAHGRLSMWAAICASERRVSSLLGSSASSFQPIAMLCSRLRASVWLTRFCSNAVPNARYLRSASARPSMPTTLARTRTCAARAYAA